MPLHRFRHYLLRNPFTVIAGIVLILFLSRWVYIQTPPKPGVSALPQVTVKDMVATPVVTSMQLNGHTAEARRVVLKAKTGGRILSLLVKKGQKVETNQDLVLIDEEDRPARLREAKARLHQRFLEFKASTQLQAKAVKSQNALAASNADYENAKSLLATMEQEMADTRIKAPFNSILEETFVEVGDVVHGGDRVATVIELDPLTISCDVSDKYMARLSLGEEARVNLPSFENQQITAKVTYIAKVADPKTRTYRVEMEAANPNMAIPAGLTARITFSSPAARGYIVSPAAISLKEDGVIGIKTVEEGKVIFHPVQIVETRPEGLLVTGLPDAISLVTTGGDFVIEGQPVKPCLNPEGDRLEKTP